MSRTLRRRTVLTGALALTAATAAAAGAQVPTLDRVDSLVTAGQYAEASATLDRWWSARETFDVPGSDRARGLMLRARLAADPREAEPDYLAVVLGYPTSPHAPVALLRLGQGLLASGDAVRSAAYLERLVSDYPGRPERTTALLWLARANSAARRPAAACVAAREGLLDTRDPDLAAMLRIEEGSSCGLATAGDAPAGTPVRRDPTPAAPTPAPTTTAPTRPAATTQAAEAGRYSVQTGAFRQQASVDAILERLRAAGHQPRVALVPNSDLMRVRVGRFATAEDAARLLARIRGQGFDAVVVTDADRERTL